MERHFFEVAVAVELKVAHVVEEVADIVDVDEEAVQSVDVVEEVVQGLIEKESSRVLYLSLHVHDAVS